METLMTPEVPSGFSAQARPSGPNLSRPARKTCHTPSRTSNTTTSNTQPTAARVMFTFTSSARMCLASATASNFQTVTSWKLNWRVSVARSAIHLGSIEPLNNSSPSQLCRISLANTPFHQTIRIHTSNDAQGSGFDSHLALLFKQTYTNRPCFDVFDVMELNNDEIRRYSRHLILPEVGLSGQKKICSTSVLCIGAGGLGSPIAMYLAAAGVGKLGILDFDAVDFSNLQRQILHGTEDVGRPKTESARGTINRLNPNVQVVVHNTRITSENALEIIRPYDIVVDGTDNFPTRYLTNDACVLLKKPNVYGSIFRFEGQASVFAPHMGGPCYRCLYPEPPPPGMVPSCAEGGVLGVLPGIIGCIQTTEILKLALEKGNSLVGRLLLVDALGMRFREVKLKRNPDCVLCGPKPTITKLIDYEIFCGITPEP